MVFAKIAQDPFVDFNGVVGQWLIQLSFVIVFSLILFTCLFLLRLAVNSINRKLKIALILFAILISSAAISQIRFQSDDETILAFFAYHSLMSGQNPYVQNYTSQLVPALSVVREGATYYQNGSPVANYGYPALYLLVQMPFFALFNPTAITVENLVMPTEYAVFFAFFLLVCYQLTKEKNNQLPVYSAIILASIVFLVFSSTIILLMLSLILLMFTNIGKKYSWLVLGLMVSLQQELWILALMFIAYELWHYDVDKSVRTAFGALIVFLLINGYFIALNPAAFFGSFWSVSSLAPNNIAPIAAILMILNVPLWIISILFILISIVLIILAGVHLEYKWIPLLSAVPYLLLSHTIPVYFILPFAAYGMIQDG